MLTYCRPHLQNGDFCRDFEPAVRGLEPRLSKFTTLVRYSKTAYLSRIFAQRSAILLGFTEDRLFPTSSSGPTSNIIYNERYNDRYKPETRESEATCPRRLNGRQIRRRAGSVFVTRRSGSPRWRCRAFWRRTVRP